MKIQPFIVGSGMSGRAMARSLALIGLMQKDFEVLPAIQVARDQDLGPLAKSVENPVLCIANPHGLHARYLLLGAEAGFKHMIVDKPACVRTEEISRLESIQAEVAVCHGYRQMWGPQAMKTLIQSGECGEVFSIEGRYWQASAGSRAIEALENAASGEFPSPAAAPKVAAIPDVIEVVAGDPGERTAIIDLSSTSVASEPAPTAMGGLPAFNPNGPVAPASRRGSWKNDPELNGPYDTLVDLGTHCVDLVFYLIGAKATRITGWLSRVNAESPSRDTHAQLSLEFGTGRRSFVSVSKTFHGGTNDFEMHVMGSLKSLSWSFLNPDELVIGEGSRRIIVRRESTEFGTRSRPFHAMGWIEGYTEVIHQALRRMAGLSFKPVPTLSENLDVMEAVLSAELSE